MKRPGNRTKHVSIRFDAETHDKLFYIAEYKGRSGSGQIVYLIRKCIAEFEKENGVIEFEGKENG
jgi:predicted DNA-binding protein